VLKASDSGRVILNESGKDALNTMLDDLTQNESCIQITPAKLVTWILCHFQKSGFTECRDAILQAHFDSRKYLKQAVNSKSSPEELADVLQSVLAKIKPEITNARITRRIRRVKPSAETSPASTDSGSESLRLIQEN
jgi:hypothetical protein